jgi:hypothetical protein
MLRRRTVRITVSHDRASEEVKQAGDRSFDDVLKAILILPIHLIQEHRAWQGRSERTARAKRGVWFPDLRKNESFIDMAILVKF